MPSAFARFARRIVIVAAAVAALTSPSFAQDQNTPVITVFGEAGVKVAPDIAFLSAGVTADGKTARDASDANSRAMEKVFTALKDLGIAAEDIQTSRVSVQPVREASRDPNRPAPPRIVGFQAVNQVRVTIRDLARTSDILDKLVTAGANDVSGLQFAVSEPGKHLDDARARAIADARRKAEIYARAAGADVGRPISISEEGATPAPAPFKAAAVSRAAMPISIGEEELHVSVNVTFELRR